MSKKNRDDGEFIKIEYNLLDLVEYNGVKVDAAMKVILSMAVSYAKKGKTYYESIPTIGKRIGRTDNPTSALLKKMKEAGMIEIDTQTGSTSKISPTLDASLMVFIDDETVKTPAKTSSEDVSPDVNTDKPVPSTESAAVEIDPAEVEIFDQNGVITEAFIRRSGADLNEDGTLKSGWYVYAYARAEQARREGLSDSQIDDALESYRAAAKPEYIPQHLHSPTWATLPEQQNQQSQPTEAA